MLHLGLSYSHLFRDDDEDGARDGPPADETVIGLRPPEPEPDTGEQQVVRLGLMQQPDTENERAYRVFFTELEPPELPEQTASGINMRLRFGIPVFVAPLADRVPLLDFLGLETVDGHTFMKLRNLGNVRVKVTEVRYESPLQENSDAQPAVFYLHPGASGSLALEFPELNTGGSVELVTDTAGVLDYALAEQR